MASANQICAFRELVLAHHAYERSLQEFAKSVGLNLTSRSGPRSDLWYRCQELDGREISEETTTSVIKRLEIEEAERIERNKQLNKIRPSD